MADRLHRIDVHNPQTMGFERSLPVACDGVNHADYFTQTGTGAHGIYPDRQGRRTFVSNRDAGSVSVLEPPR
jgi:hypothetical protein